MLHFTKVLLLSCALLCSGKAMAQNTWYTNAFGGVNYTDLSDPGYVIGLSVGARPIDERNKYELELTYRENKNSHSTLSKSYSRLEYSLKQINLALNSVFELLPASIINPYFGFGAGASYRTSTTFNFQKNQIKPALQEIVGIASDKFSHGNIALEYRHVHNAIFETTNHSFSLNCGLKF